MGNLTLRQEKFVQALTTPNSPTYCNQTAAYHAAYPAASLRTARQGGYENMTKPDIQAAVKGQLDVAQMGKELKHCLRVAKSVQKSLDPSLKLSATRETRDTIMDYAKLTGQLVEKREQVNIDGAASDAIRQLVSRSMRLPSATLTPSAATVKANDDSTNSPLVNQHTDQVANG